MSWVSLEGLSYATFLKKSLDKKFWQEIQNFKKLRDTKVEKLKCVFFENRLNFDWLSLKGFSYALYFS